MSDPATTVGNFFWKHGPPAWVNPIQNVIKTINMYQIYPVEALEGLEYFDWYERFESICCCFQC